VCGAGEQASLSQLATGENVVRCRASENITKCKENASLRYAAAQSFMATRARQARAENHQSRSAIEASIMNSAGRYNYINMARVVLLAW
jgi:hypothetical protein